MRIAITGATGLIGSAVAKHLTGLGHEVIGIGRRAREGSVLWDPSAGTVDLDGLGHLDGIVHLAGESIGGRWTTAKRQAILDSRIEGTRLVGRIVGELGVSSVVSGSAIGFYGDRDNEILTEQSQPGDGFLADVVKRWEEEARAIAEGGARVTMIRTGIVLDEDEGTLPRLVRLFKLGAGGTLGSGEQWWSWISLADEVRAITMLLDNEEIEGPVNLTAPNPVTNRMMTKTLAKALSRPAILPAPAFALKAVLGADFAEELLLASQRVLPGVLSQYGFEFEYSTLDGALAAILS